MRTAARTDDNQREIVTALRRLGYSVAITSQLGKGFPDLTVGKYGHNYLFEVKDGKKPPSARKLTEDELDFHSSWKGSVHIIESLDDILEFDRKHSRRHS